MIFYVLMTYGARPTGAIAHHPAAQAQLKFFGRVCAANPQIKPRYVVDYARRVDGLDSLPNLGKCLDHIVDIEGAMVSIDDLARIFRITELIHRTKLLSELQKFGSIIRSFRHKKLLSDFTGSELRLLVLHPEKSKHPASQARNRDTVDARAASLQSRIRQAREAARAIQQIKDDLLTTERKVSLQVIADEANARGLRTTRGVEWTAPNVDRTLRLLKQAHQEK